MNCESTECKQISRKLGSHVFETLMKNGYDCVAEIDDETGELVWYYVGALFTQRGVTPDAIGLCRDLHEDMSEFSALAQLVADRLGVEDERETIREQITLGHVCVEISQSGVYARTFHIDVDGATQAENLRIRNIESIGSHRLLMTFQDITGTLDHDWMTDEYAHTGFLREAEKLVKESPQDDRYALIYANVRGFKAINDLFGEQTGDIVIFQVRDALRELLHPLIMGRIDADHFVMITEKKSASKDAMAQLGSRIYSGNGKKYRYSVRCGICPIRRNGDMNGQFPTVTHMLDCARLAEKSVRSEIGENYAIYADELKKKYVNGQMLLSDMKDSLANGEFMVYYQPIVDAKTEKPVSAEALARWKHHSLGMVSPGQFIPAFEHGGVISRLDSYMITRVFERLSDRNRQGLSTVPVALNLSRADFYDQALLEQIMDAIHSNSILPSLVRFEVTESAYLTLENDAVDFLMEMKRLGVPILLDDYGSGMSSLSTIASFDFDVIKLDMGFIRKIGDSKSNAIIRSAIEMAHDLGAGVVAEGVETTAQREFLSDNGCDMIQGYYYYKPEPQEEFDRMLDQEKES